VANKNFPKVLFVSPSAFNHITGGGVTFSHLFAGWPKDRLATVTDDSVPVSRDVCSQYYFMTESERSLIPPFNVFVKKKKIGGLSPPGFQTETKSRLSRTVHFVLGDAGIPDRGRLTPALHQWIKAFQPEVLYTILGSLGYIELVDQIQQKTKLPLAIHLMDDGVTNPQKKGMFGRFIGREYNDKFCSLLKRTTIRIAICEEMAEAYEERYGYAFEHFQNTVDADAWSALAKKDLSIKDHIKVVYTGSILPYAQLQSLRDCCRAVDILSREGLKISLDIYTPLSLFGSYIHEFPKSDVIRFHETITDDEMFFAILGQADVLLLPVNFDLGSRQFIRYSMPTKVPSYLTSRTPILVYGPPDVAQVRYAIREKWGYTVNEKGVDRVKLGLLELVQNLELRKNISEAARRAAQKNHDAVRIRARFQTLLRKGRTDEGDNMQP
jgi:glycosyltransferase involved in cell wall biosynthesis